MTKNLRKTGSLYEKLAGNYLESKGYEILEYNFRCRSGEIDIIAKKGNISERDMFNTFNMGVGMTVVVSKEDKEEALKILKENCEDAYVIGEIVKGDEKIIL